MQTTQWGLGDCFKRAKQAIYNANIMSGLDAAAANAAVDNAVLSQSYLRLEQPITTNNSVITFPVLSNQSSGVTGTAQRASEIRLDQQDAFFVSNIAVYIALAASATATTFFPQTYPNPSIFSTGGAITGGSQPLMSFYNGFLKLTVNKSVIIPQYPLLNFYYIPQTQLTAATNSPETQFDPNIVSLWEPNINLIGSKANNFSINMPNIPSAVDANTYAVILLQGILAQNVTILS